MWRCSEKPCEDHRRYKNGHPLRQSQDVSFLSWKSCGSPGFLHESQISCVVARTDDWRWVAYCFVDTFFDAAQEAKESVLSYHKDSLGDERMRADPLTYGVTNADQPIQNPREYFLSLSDSCCPDQTRVAASGGEDIPKYSRIPAGVFRLVFFKPRCSRLEPYQMV